VSTIRIAATLRIITENKASAVQALCILKEGGAMGGGHQSAEPGFDAPREDDPLGLNKPTLGSLG
ncbi:MAG: hypothetical protein VX796_15755, partial [Pseudomonadota bacterium]|nr:hypothetical protein [Pseudomonadota bacterium]